MGKSVNVTEEMKNDFCSKTVGYLKDLARKLKLHGKFTMAPIIKTSPSLLFRVFAYSLLLTYSSDWYNGIGLLFPFGLFMVMTLLSFVIGKWTLPIRDPELLVNAVSGVVLPIYIDIFDVVSTICLKYCR